MNDDEFFDSTPELQTIRQWAHARFAAKWAVFLAVLGRVFASTSPGVQLPGVIGGPASLNMILAFVAPSGGGKGITDRVAREAWPAAIIERPIGSGEGIAALFAPPRKEGAERITQAILHSPEIDTMAGLASRQGNIFLAQLKSAVMGEMLGQSNASEATSRIVLPHSYRLVLSVGAQPGHCDVIFNDTSGGTPQRVVWVLTVDKDMPAEAPPDPEPLNTRLPAWAHTNTVMTYGPPEIREQIIAAHLARQRGEASALDGHRMLTRLKVAAGIAILHHRSVISELDWRLSDTVMSVSDQTRDWIVEQARLASRAKVRERAMARAAGEDFYDASRLETVKRSILRMLERDGEQPGNKLRSRLGKREKRDLFEQAIALLEADGLVSERTDEYNGAPRVRYRIGSGLTNEVRSENSSSEGVTREVRPDLSATVTDLDSRRSPETGRPLVPCPRWFALHVAELRAAGETVIDSLAVVRAGEALGYTEAAIRQAASKNKDTTAVGRGQWSITGTDTGYKPATEWVLDYFDGLPANTAVVDQGDLRRAAEQAGHTWTAVRAAATRSGRIKSVPVKGSTTNERTWHLITTTADGTAS